MKSSIFFPSLSSWIHAAKLFAASCTGVIFFTCLFWFFILGASVAFGDMTADVAFLAPMFLVFSLASLIAGFLFYQIVRFLFRVILRLFWQHPPGAITPKGFRASIHSYSILLIASLPSVLTMLFFEIFVLPDAPSIIYERGRYHKPSDIAATLTMLSFIITAAYLYQWFPLRRKATVKSA